jgi:hypothetical protein
MNRRIVTPDAAETAGAALALDESQPTSLYEPGRQRLLG